jgi:hypothetical protein
MPRTLALVALTIVLLLAATGSASARHYDSLLAPASICPGQTDKRRSVDAQESTMRCMQNHVRSKRGLPAPSTTSQLMSAAGVEVRRHRALPGVRPRGLRPRLLLLDQAHRLCQRLLGRRREHRLGLGVPRIGPGDHERVLHSDPHRHNLFKSGYPTKGGPG